MTDPRPNTHAPATVTGLNGREITAEDIERAEFDHFRSWGHLGPWEDCNRPECRRRSIDLGIATEEDFDMPSTPSLTIADPKHVEGKCPACGWSGLFLGDGGFVTCSQADCKDPGAAHDALNGGYEAQRRAVEFLETLADGGELLVNGVPWREMFRRFNEIVADGVVLPDAR